jgi:hypothetical protein
MFPESAGHQATRRAISRHQVHSRIATTSARSARFGTDAESGLLTIECTPMVKTHGPRRRHADGRAAAPDIDPLLKQFIDNVVIPALLERLCAAPRFGDQPTARRAVSKSAACADRLR